MESSRKIISYIAMSLDGKIARANGEVDWLDKIPNPDNSDYGYQAFYDGISATIMGGATYREVLGFDVEFPYKGKANYVFTRDKGKAEDENVRFVSDNFDGFIADLKASSGKDIWLIGGGQMNTLFLKNSWLDEMIVFIMPIVIGAGIPLFADETPDHQMELIDETVYSSGVVELKYKVK